MSYGLKLFSGNANRPLAEEIAKTLQLPLGDADVSHFSDGEVYVQINENVRGQDVFVIQPTCPPVNNHLMELLVMLDAFKRASARRITAVEAKQLGLVNHVVGREQLLPTATMIAQEILKNSPFAVRQAKWAIDNGVDLPLEEGLQREHDAYLRAIASADLREGIAAFNEKRPPQFSGR